MRSHKDLEVWKKSIDLVTEIYQTTKSFPKEELYGLTNQIRRASVSVPSNIAEGAARYHPREYIQFLYIALGSLSEVDTQIIISFNLSYISEELNSEFDNKLKEIRNMLLGLIKYIKNQDN